LLLEVVGNPFRTAGPVPPGWLQWQDGVLVKLAQSFYDESRFDGIAVLADALEEAGCTDADILDHCRNPGVHVRGCWPVDLLLAKEYDSLCLLSGNISSFKKRGGLRSPFPVFPSSGKVSREIGRCHRARPIFSKNLTP
jgi:hypothetical protein